MRLLGLLFGIFTIFSPEKNVCSLVENPTNQCVQFTVGSGTGCVWMCNYCSEQLGTNNYYFIDNVCTYQQGQGCIGSPVSGKTYTCCAV